MREIMINLLPCPFCGEQAAFYVTDYNRIRVKYTFCRCGYRNIEHEIIKRRSINMTSIINLLLIIGLILWILFQAANMNNRLK